MKKQERCVHNEAIYKELGIICSIREPNSTCDSCKKFESRYPSYCCQKCGEQIGYLGRFVEFIYCSLLKHECKIK